MNDSIKHLKRWLFEADSVADLIAGFAIISAEIIHALEHPDGGKAFGGPRHAEASQLISDWIAACGGEGRPADTPELEAAAQLIRTALHQAGTKSMERRSAGDAPKPRVCNYQGCANKATHMAGLAVRPPRSFGDGEAQVYIDLVLCPEHAGVASMKSIVSDDMWKRLSAGMTGAGKVAPDRGRTDVFTVPIDEAPEVFRVRYEPAEPKQ